MEFVHLVPFEGFLLLCGSRVAEANIYGCVIGVTITVVAFGFVSPWLAVPIPNFRGTRVVRVVAAPN